MIRWLAGAFVVFGLLFLGGYDAAAQDGHVHGHMQYHEVYKTWCQPGHGPDCPKGYSCCDGREVEWQDGKATKIEGHCYPTEYRLNPTGKTSWIAKLAPEDVPRFKTEWLEVPDDRIVRYTNPDPTGQAGHICTHHLTDRVLCSRPPAGSL
ncbi:MAG TPA: hypothetical protein VEC60_17350 [Reyranella sp.]|nr:hypothetical protein [Reyranella sp.]